MLGIEQGVKCSSAVIIVSAFAVIGCAKTSTAPTDQVQSVVRQCGLQGQIEFKRVGRGELAISHVDPKADFKRFDCVLRGLEARGIKVGFIGSEQINP